MTKVIFHTDKNIQLSACIFPKVVPNILTSPATTVHGIQADIITPLIANNDIFHKLIQNSQEGFTMVDNEYRVVYRNAAAERINGWKTGLAVPEKIDEQLHPEDKERVEALLTEILSAPGMSKSAVFRTRHADGHFIWIDCTFSNFFHDPDFKAFVFNFRDISKEKNYAEQLERSEKKFKALVENSTDGLTIFDEKRHALYLSPGVNLILGYTENEGMALNSFDIIHPDDLFYTKAKLEECLNNPGKPIRNIVYRMRHKEGHYITLNSTLTNFIADPSIGGIVNNFRDITEKKKNEAELIESENKYRNLFENNPQPLLFWEFDNLRIRECNEAAIEKYGYSREEFLSLSLKDLWPDGDQEFSQDDIISSFRTIGQFKAVKRMHKKKNGDLISIEVKGQSINYNGKNMGLAIITDITESIYYNQLDKLERDVLENATDKPTELTGVLATYLQGIEALHPGMLCSVFEQRGNKLYNMCATALPAKYVEEINGMEVCGQKGPCGKAAATKQKVITTNINKGDFSDRYKKVAELNDLKSCWSHPVMGSNHDVMAVFACYYRFEKQPSDLELKTIERAVKILQVILENRRWAQALVDSNNRFEYAMEATYDVIWDLDMTTNSAYYSGNFKKIFGYEIGLRTDNRAFMQDTIHPDDLKNVVIESNDIKHGNAKQWAWEYRFKKANGDYAYVEDRAIVIRDENGIATRMVGAMKDITRQKQEEQHLKLLESVVINTNDAVLITEALALDATGPRILYVNDAFTNMTGYLPDEVVGQTPQLLMGEMTDKAELQRCVKAVNNWQPFEGSIINYKKNGEMYWKEFSVSPVADHTGTYTHWIAVERDVTSKKNDEIQKGLRAEVNQLFNNGGNLKNTLEKVLKRLLDLRNFDLGEVWLADPANSKFNLIAKQINCDTLKQFYEESSDLKSFDKAKSLPEDTSLIPPVIFWHHKDDKKILRHKAALDAGLKTAYIIPLKHNNEVTGILLLGSKKDEPQNVFDSKLLEHISPDFSAAINRKQLQEELNQVFDFTPDILCIANTDGYFKKVNPAISRILGYTEDELLSRPFISFVHPDDRENTISDLRKLIDGNSGTSLENRYITKTGKTKWLTWTTTLPDEQGVMYCSAKDTTEKKELEELLNKATRLARIGGWDVDPEYRIVNWSDITREIHEVEPDFIVDITSTSVFYREGEERDRIVKAMTEAVSYGTPADMEMQITTAKGNRKWVRLIIETEFSEGKCTKLYGSFQDIDVRKKAELAEITALADRNVILESITDGFFAVDKNWVVTYWNNTAEHVLKVPRDKILNQQLWTVFVDSIDSESYKMYHQSLELNSPVHFEDYYPSLGMWFEISAYPSGTGLSVYFKDITERKRSETLLKELNTNLENQAKALAISNDELEQFAYVASHDLQEPLRMVTSFMTQLESKYSDVVDDRGRKYIHYAVDGARRMRQIILDLLEFSRVGKGNHTEETVDVNKLMDDIVALYARQIEEMGATISFDALPTILTFKTPMKQVFQNLIGNSLKYHKPGEAPAIQVACKETKTHYQFSVKDNGIGISSAYFDRIFIIFQRLHNMNEYSGTGMGLAITKKIVENMGGKIWVKSEEGNGSQFYFTIAKHNK